MASPFPRDYGFTDTIIAPHAAKNELVLHLIEDELGEPTRRVAAFLLSTYHCTLSHIIRYFLHKCHPSRKLSAAEVRRNLLVLQQHRCLLIERPPSNDVLVDGPRGGNPLDNTLLYSIDTDMAINRGRTGRMLYRAREACRGCSIPLFVASAATAAGGAAVGNKGETGSNKPQNDISNANLSSRGAVPDRSRRQLWEDIGNVTMELLILHGRATLEQVLAEVSAHVEAQANAALASRLKELSRIGDIAAAELAEREAQTDIVLRKQESRFLAYHIFEAFVQQRLISRAKKLTAPRQQAMFKFKTVRGPKGRAGAPAPEDAYVGPGRAAGARSVRARSRTVQVEEEEEDAQLPDEMRAGARERDTPDRAPAPAPASQGKRKLASSIAATAPGTGIASSAQEALQETGQVDRFAVIEARPEDSDADERQGFGPLSREKLLDPPPGTKGARVAPKTLAVSEQNGTPANENASEPRRAGKRLAADSGSEEEEEEEEEEEPTRKPRKGSSSSMELDEELTPKGKTKAKGKKKESEKAPAKKRARAAAETVAPVANVVEVDEPEEVEDLTYMNYLARKDVFWAVNWDQLFEEERIGVCVRYTRERLKEKAARVLRIMLEESLRDENAGAAAEDLCYLQRYTPHTLSPPVPLATIVAGSVANTRLDDYTYNEMSCINMSLSEDKAERGKNKHVPATQMLEHSRPMDLMRIINTYARKYVSGSSAASNHESLAAEPEVAPATPEGAEKVLDISTLRMLLDVLVADTSLSACRGYNSYTENSGAPGEYVANVGTMVSILQRKTITSIARARYGVQTARLVELMLTRNEWMEQTALGDIAILPAREAREKLYLLYRDKWVDFREISKRHDFNPQSTYYFWKVDYQHLRGVVLEHSYRGMLNLRIKRASLLREAGDKDLESQALALYAEAALRSSAGGGGGDKAGMDAATLSTTVGILSTSSSANATVSDISNANAATTESAAGSLANGTTAISVDGAASSAAVAIYRGSIMREEEKRLQDATGLHRDANSLGMDVAIGRLDLAMHNLDLTIMLLDRFES